MTKILVIDDDTIQRLILRTPLEMDGYEVLEAENGIEALKQLSENPDIRFLVTDLMMPEMDGFKLIDAVRKRAVRYTYIIVMTSMEDRSSLLQALSLGADDYLTKPIMPEELKLRLRSGMRLLKLEGQDELIFSMAKMAEFRSEETGFHLERVYHYCRILARDFAVHYPEYELTPGIADEIATVSPLHDIGKVAIPDHILHKPGRLTPDEWGIMKTHAAIGGNLIREIYDRTGSPWLRFAYEIAMYHHERWDGKGYPGGLAAEDIPVPARIMMLADVYDALTSERCYKPAFSHEKARAILLEENGSHFDPRLIDGFLRQEEQWLAVRNRFQD
ncbi:HD-GYP domain-containing protein [Desulfonema ishimotonii]|nr:HD domain-containing phosphohydrolase [Desulfonema ishimotonii]